MDNPTKPMPPKLAGFYKLDPQASEHSHQIDIADLVAALDATTRLLDDVFCETRRDEPVHQLHGLAIAARIFAGMIADRHSGEEVVTKQTPRSRRPPGTRKQKRKAAVVTLVRSTDGAGTASAAAN